MTDLERIMAAFRHQPVDRLPWMANMDHWYNVNKTKGGLPEKYKDWHIWDIQKDLGSAIWQRCGVIKSVGDSKVKTHTETDGPVRNIFYETPVGTVYETYRVAEDSASTQFRIGWMIKKPEDFRVVKYLQESENFEPNYEHFIEIQKQVAEDGVTLAGACSDPIMSARHLMGLESFAYALIDEPELIDELIGLLTRKAVESARVAAKGPSDVLIVGGNIESQVVSRNLFQRYAVPFFQKVCGVLHEHKKLAQYHFDGFIKPLLPLMDQTDLDIIEGFTPVPQADATIEELFAELPDSIAVQGAVPSCVLCYGFPYSEMEKVAIHNIEYGKTTGRFLLGLGDNTPPDADISRLARIGELVDEYGWCN